MTRLSLYLTAMFAVTSTIAMAEEPRHADAHEHGHGQLTIAIDDSVIEMELEVPGSDIVGFEHQPETPAQQDAFDAAKAALAAGDALFTVTGGASCRLSEYTFLEDDDHDHDKKSGEEDHEAEHMEFHVTYRFACDDTGKISGFAFPFFARFPGSEELDVQIVSPNGQFQFEVEPNSPVLTLD